MSDDVSLYIQQVKEGRDEDASGQLWEKYFDRLVNVAKRNLGTLPKRVADEEDVAVSAIHSFFKAAEGGRFEQLSNRDELWKLLVTIVIRKSNRYKEKATAQKRGGGNVRGESVFMNAADDGSPGLAGIPDEGFVDDLMFECSELMHKLDDDVLRQIALLKMEGHTTEEVAEKLAIARSTVKRKLNLIKESFNETLEERKDEDS